MRREKVTLNVPVASSGSGTASDCARLEEMGVQITGTFVADVDIEISLDGTTYEVLATVSAKSIVQQPLPAEKIKITVRNWVSGQPAALLVGLAY